MSRLGLLTSGDEFDPLDVTAGLLCFAYFFTLEQSELVLALQFSLPLALAFGYPRLLLFETQVVPLALLALEVALSIVTIASEKFAPGLGQG